MNNIVNSNTLVTDLAAIRSKTPLVHNITNFVVMELTANALLAIGASPIMAHAIEEIGDIVQLSQALVLNIGTLDNNWVASMQQAAKVAQVHSIPIVLDPVGAGATKFRTDTVLKIINEVPPTVIRGNAAEIMSLAGIEIQSQGVDSKYATNAALEAGKILATRYKCVVVISGAEDLIISDSHYATVKNGNPMMAKVTGMGCTATAIMGAFCAINSNNFLAATHSMAVMGIAGELAANNAKGPGSFQANFLDCLYNIEQQTITKRLQVEYK